MFATATLAVIFAAQSGAIASCDAVKFYSEQHEKRTALTGQISESLSHSQQVSQQRIAIAQRLVEISEGKGRFKGAFDPNWSSESLRAKDRSLQTQQELIQHQLELYQIQVELMDADTASFQALCGTSK